MQIILYSTKKTLLLDSSLQACRTLVLIVKRVTVDVTHKHVCLHRTQLVK